WSPSLTVLENERLDGQPTKSGKRRRQTIAGPVPPGDPQQRVLELPVEPVADDSRRHAGDDGKARHVLADDRAGTDRRAVADRDSRQNHGAMPDPDVVAHRHLVAPA